jgi:hypothetical protein
MNSTLSSLLRFGTRPCCRLLSVFVTAGVVVSGYSSESAGPGTAPPAYRDTAHVPLGCYISTYAYLAKFLANYPHEVGQPLTVNLPSFGGPHTIALVSWQGRWWGRDEYSGVYELRCAVAETHDIEQLGETAEYFLRRLSAWHHRTGKIGISTRAPAEIADGARWDSVRTAARLLPIDSQIFRVSCRKREIPLLFFQPAANVIAVYDPANGTATAECELRSATTIVAMVASRLGYKVVAVWPEQQLVSVDAPDRLAR